MWLQPNCLWHFLFSFQTFSKLNHTNYEIMFSLISCFCVIPGNMWHIWKIFFKVKHGKCEISDHSFKHMLKIIGLTFGIWMIQRCFLIMTIFFMFPMPCSSSLSVLYPTHNEVVVGINWFHSVRPSVRPASRVRSVAPTVLVGSISYLYILSSNFRRCVACKVSCKISKFGFWAIF